MIGLDSFDPVTERFTAHFAPTDTPGHTVDSILEDERGKLWMSSNKGLFEFDPKTRTFKHFSFFPGLQGFDLSGWGAGFRSPNGKMYFGGFAGGISFYPDKLNDSPGAQSTVLTDLRLLYTPAEVGSGPLPKKTISYADSLTLSHDQNSFSLEFSALNYIDPLGTRYRYRLEGLDNRWIEVDARHRQASYTFLPPTRYVFRVESATSSGNWAEPGVVLPINILPAWWQTWWFRGASGLAVLSMLVAGYLTRVKNIERREYGLREQSESRHAAVIAERNRIARDFHDTFAQGFTGVIVQLEAAKGAAERESTPEALAHINRAGDLARTCLGEARQSVSAMRQSAPSERTLREALDELLKRMSTGIELKTHLQVEGEPRMLPAVCHDGLLGRIRRGFVGRLPCLISGRAAPIGAIR